MCRKASGGSKREGVQPHVKCEHAPTGLYGGESILTKSCTCIPGRVLGPQVWRKKQDNWPKVNKKLEGLSYLTALSHFLTALLLIQYTYPHSSSGVYFCLASNLLCSSSLGRPPIPFLSVSFCPASILNKQTFCLCAVPHVLLCLWW